jgi:8-oxo-dGTP diphosphatase
VRIGQEVQAVSREALAPAHIVEVVVGLIENASGDVLVNRRLPGTHMAGLWEFPGGKRRPLESAFAALKRELEEELAITVLAAEPFLTLTHDYGDRRVALDVWRVERFDGVPRSAERQELRWASLEDLAALDLLAADGPIVEALRVRRQLNMSPNGTFFVD